MLPEIRDEADFVIILSNLAPEMNRDIAAKYPYISAILNDESGETERIGDVLLAYSEAKGKTLGVLTLRVEGDAQRASAEQIALTEAVPDDPKVRTMLDDFYEQVATDPLLQKQGEPLFFGEPFEGDAGNGYVGSEACKTCHPEVSDQVDALLARRRVQHSLNRRAAVLPGMRVLPRHRFRLRDRLPN